MTQEHPITPSEDQIMLWCKQWNCTKEPGPIHKWLAIQAARWGADQELEWCVNYVDNNVSGNKARALRALRRPKPPSLKEKALLQLDTLNADLGMHGLGCDLSQIRRAIESLPS